MRKRGWWLLLPSLTGFCVFFVVPFFGSLYYAFTDNAFNRNFAGLENFKALASSEYFRLAMKNTVLFTGASVPLVMALSLLLALLLVRFLADAPFIKSAFFLPVVLPSATIVTLWQAYFAKIPPFTSLLALFLWKYTGLNLIILLAALAALNKEMLEAAKIDGASFGRSAWLIMLPNLAPALFFTLVLSFVNSLKIYRESYLLFGSYPETSVYMLQNYLNNHFVKLNYQVLSAAALLFFLLVYAVVGLLFRAEKKLGEKIW